MADKLYTVVDGVPSPLDLGTGGSGENLPGIDERVTALEEYQIVQDEAIAQTRNELEASIEENKGILPVGMEYIRLTGQTPYPGGVDYLGQEVTRAMYADLWTWQNEHKPESIISEEAWQALYASQNGNVPFFSTGDGSTTFRFPRSVGYLKIAGTVGDIGAYKAEGLPDHTHTRGTMNITGSQQLSAKRFPNAVDSSRTALYSSTTSSSGYFSTGSDSTSGITTINLDASRSWTGETSPASESNPIYGSSPHVTPESMTVVMGVIAISVTGALGEATEEGIVAELGEHGAKLGEHGAKLGELEAAIEAFHDNCVGEIFSWPADSEPYRALPINGAAVSRTTYAKLFAKIGTKYGAGDGSTTFNVPNGIGKFLQCDNTAGMVKAAGLPNITGHFDTSPCNGASSTAKGAFFWESGKAGTRDGGNGMGFDASRSNSIYGASSTVQPPALTMRYYIKY